MKKLIIVLDSLKFYKLKNETTARILFLLLYLIFLASDIFPLGQGISPDELTKILQGDRTALLSLFSSGYIIFIAFQFAIYLVTSFIGLIYANCYVMQSEGFPNKKAIISSFRALPRLIGYMLLLITPIIISSIFAFIPLIYLFYAMFFVPLLIMEGKQGVFEAIISSFKSTKGIKVNIFISQVMLYFLMNIPITLFSSAFYYVGSSNTISEFLVLSFLRAAYVLMGGRLVGNFYFLVMRAEEKDKKIFIDLFKNTSNPDVDKETSDDEDSDNSDNSDDDSNESSDNEKK